MDFTKIIDTHTHIFPDTLAPRAIASLAEHSGDYKPHTEGTLNSLLTSMDEAGIHTSWIANIATKPSQTSSIIAWSKEIADERIFPLGSVYPYSETWEKDIDDLFNAGIRAVKLHPLYQHFYADAPDLYDFFSMLEKKGIMTVLHAGYDIGFGKADNAHPSRIRTLVERHPSLTLVAAHLGGWDAWKDVLPCLAGSSCYFDTSFSHETDTSLLESIMEKHGIDRLVFGSDSPWLNQKQQVLFIKSLGLSEADEQKIFFKNASYLQSKYNCCL